MVIIPQRQQPQQPQQMRAVHDNAQTVGKAGKYNALDSSGNANNKST